MLCSGEVRNPPETGGQFLQRELGGCRSPLAALNEFGKQEGLGAGGACQLPSVFSPTPLPVVLRISSSFEVDGGAFLASYLDRR